MSKMARANPAPYVPRLFAADLMILIWSFFVRALKRRAPSIRSAWLRANKARRPFGLYEAGHRQIFHHRQMPGGAYRDRTDDLMLAKQPLSQLS